MRASAFLYPWDVIGDSEAPGRLAGLGVQQVTLASAYHSTRALTPRHPHTRIVTARHSAVLYPADPARWAGRALRPYAQGWLDSADPFGEAAHELAAAGLEVHSWVVLAHNSRLGEEHPHTSVRNAYGDRYPWAPCIAQPEVREYAVTLAAEAAVRPGARGTELESCGWYGLAHLHAHDKTGGVPLGPVAEHLMSLCFCATCQEGYASLDADPEKLRRTVLRALAPLWRGAPEPHAPTVAEERQAVAELLGTEHASAVSVWRDGAANRLQREAVAAVRAEARARTGADARTGDGFRVLLHAHPGAHRTGANAGTEPAAVLEHADGVVLPCGGGAAARTAVLEPFARASADRSAGTDARTAVLAANFPVVSGMGGAPDTLAEDAVHARELGARELRLYHAGLASDGDLAQVRDALKRIG
ncbi:hypothetical protein DVA86_10625 [Streptomyces armeniacus]|uniref:Alanine-rich protein n=1 Tax=Streptomyces armeniacus TaxID=83291 RepID=A0A345XN19_9ACTN|nr:hypothetical protein [Streptomyces armeniacus]AXK33035.1 hypothetical protein DVA86_10625 [Streptomyces armeniacus]